MVNKAIIVGLFYNDHYEDTFKIKLALVHLNGIS